MMKRGTLQSCGVMVTQWCVAMQELHMDENAESSARDIVFQFVSFLTLWLVGAFNSTWANNSQNISLVPKGMPSLFWKCEVSICWNAQSRNNSLKQKSRPGLWRVGDAIDVCNSCRSLHCMWQKISSRTLLKKKICNHWNFVRAEKSSSCYHGTTPIGLFLSLTCRCQQHSCGWCAVNVEIVILRWSCNIPT